MPQPIADRPISKMIRLQMSSVGTNPSSLTFTGTLSCQSTFDGQSTSVDRLITMTVNYAGGLSSLQEQHEYAFQPFTITANAGRGQSHSL